MFGQRAREPQNIKQINHNQDGDDRSELHWFSPASQLSVELKWAELILSWLKLNRHLPFRAVYNNKALIVDRNTSPNVKSETSGDLQVSVDWSATLWNMRAWSELPSDLNCIRKDLIIENDPCQFIVKLTVAMINEWIVKLMNDPKEDAEWRYSCSCTSFSLANLLVDHFP